MFAVGQLSSASAARTFFKTPPGVGYQNRLVLTTFRSSIETLSSPRPPRTVSTSTPPSFFNSASTREAIAFFASQTGQQRMIIFFITTVSLCQRHRLSSLHVRMFEEHHPDEGERRAAKSVRKIENIEHGEQRY